MIRSIIPLLITSRIFGTPSEIFFATCTGMSLSSSNFAVPAVAINLQPSSWNFFAIGKKFSLSISRTVTRIVEPAFGIVVPAAVNPLYMASWKF